MRTIRKNSSVLIALLLLSGMIVGMGWQFAAPGRAVVSAQDTSRISDTAIQQIQALMAEKESRTPAQQKLDSQLLYTLKMRRGEPIAAGVPTLDVKVEVDPTEKTVVDITALIGGNTLIEDLEAVGAEIISVYPQYNFLRASVPLAQLENIAAFPAVRFIQPKQEGLTQRHLTPPSSVVSPAPFTGFAERAARVREALPRLLAASAQDQKQGPIPNAGSRISEGDSTHRAATARSQTGVNGAGVRIGVLSDGVSNLVASQARGDLLFNVTVLPGQGGVGDEGTAMLEIVHDLAPGAQLFYATAFNGAASFAQNIRDLRAAGCQIIVDDVSYGAESPFQDGQAPGVISTTNGGIIAQAVNDVTAAGALYFSSAANSGNKNDNTSGTWEGDFVDGGPLALLPGGTVHNFGGGTTFNTITASGGFGALFWSDPLGGSSNDYDLFILNSTGTAVVASSTNVQNGTQDPIELVGGTATNNRVVILKKTGAASRFLHLNVSRGVLTFSTEGETHGHSCGADAFGVAATPAATAFGPSYPVGPFPNPFNASNKVELFSSDGPRRLFFQANGTPITPGNFSATGGLLRQKPDITAADGVTVTGVGFFNPFYGTSAAAPHAAAIAALLKSANPTLTNAQIRAALTSSAIDIESPGVDRNSGAGIIMADAALQFIGAAPSANFELVAVTATEVGGNGNGLIERGEGGSLSVQLQNTGAVNATGITANLTTVTPGVTITQGTSAYPNLAIPSGLGSNTTPFAFTVSSNAVCPLQINFTLTLNYAGGASPKVTTFSIQTGTPPLKINSTLDPTAPIGGPGFTAITGVQTGRLTRTGAPSECAFPSACPGVFTAADARRFDAYTFTNCSTSSSCVSVSIANSCTTTAANLFAVAYLGTFNPSNLCASYLGDSGASLNGVGAEEFSFTVPAGATFTVVVHEVTPNGATGCNYLLNLSGLCCQAGGNCPTISNIAPTSGAANTSVTLTGANFTGVTSVRFANNVPAAFTIVNDTTITATVPTGAVTGPITLSKPGCQDLQTASFTVPGSVFCPSVDQIAPLTGSPGDTVKITGANLTGVTLVKSANGVEAAFTVVNDTTINVIVPGGMVTGPFTLSKPGCGDVLTDVFTPIGSGLASVLAAPPATITAESCGTPNTAIDPGETVTVLLPLKNIGTTSTTNLVATLRGTGGVLSPSAPQTYGALPGSGPAVAKSFTFTADPALTCGNTLTATLQLQDGTLNLGTATFTFTVGKVVTAFSENFDGGTAPFFFPAGWIRVVLIGNADGWITSPTSSDTAPNNAFSSDPSTINDIQLTSPQIAISTASAQLTFRNNYNLETSFDGGVLEISINNGAFTDIITAGGSFVTGGYNFTISSNFSNPIGGRQAWSGNSGGYITTTVNLPASAAGKNIKLRWRLGTDNSGSGAGWRIDTISITDGFICQTSCTPVCPTVTNISPTSGAVGSNVTITGTNFNGVTSVKFSNNVTAVFTVNTSTTITATVPAGAITGPITISKTGCGDVQTASFTVTSSCPTITNLSPTSGAIGSSVTITGTNFTGLSAGAVTFTNNLMEGGRASATFTVVNDTTITATVPLGVITGPIIIRKQGCADAQSASFTVTQACPTITLSPTNLPAGTLDRFDFALDSLQVDGNIHGGGNPDGTPEFLDNFDDGLINVFPTVEITSFSPIIESGGFLRLLSEGANTFTPGFLVDHNYLGLADGSLYRLQKGGKNSIITASFRADVPLPGQNYGLQLLTLGTNELVNIQVGRGGTDTVVIAASQPDSGPRVTQSVVVNLTGVNRIILRLSYNDATSRVTYAFSIDGGSTFTTITLPQPGVVMTTGSQGIVSVFGSVSTYNQTLTASGGIAPYSFAVTAGTLPGGLTLTPSGILSGIPNAVGTFNFTVTATDANGCTGTRSYSIVINCQTITLSPSTLPSGTVGTAYNQTVSASPSGTYTFAITAGSLPAGLSLNSTTGVITGTPTTAGTASFTITALSFGPCSGSQAYTINIQAGVTCPTVTSISPNNGAVGSSVTITGTGFTGLSAGAVKFSTNVTATFTVVNDTTITATVPSGAVTGPITISKTGCNDVQTASFTVTIVSNCVPVSISTTLTGGAGSSLTVPIIVGDLTGKGVSSYDFTLTFDPAVVKPSSTPFDSAGTLSSGLTVTPNTATPGKLTVSAFGTTSLTGAGTLLNLKFDLIGATSACSNLTWTSFVFNEGLPCATTSNGQICIGGGSIAGTVNYGTSSTPKTVPGVTLAAAGTPAATSTTNNAGAYSLTGLGGGPYTVTPTKTGDVNGISSFDASQTAQHVAGLITLTANQQIAGDASGNGTLSSFDASLIAQFAAGIPNPGSIAGTWKFVPANRSYPTLSGNLANQNFDAILVGDVSGNWTPPATVAALATSLAAAPSESPGGVTNALPPITVSLPNATGATGANVTIPITVGNLTGSSVVAYDFVVTFDPAVLQLQSPPIDATGTLSSGMNITPNTATPGLLRISAFGTTPLTGAGTLLNLKFNVLGAAGTTTALTWQSFNFNEGDPPATLVNGSFTVPGAGNPVPVLTSLNPNTVTAGGAAFTLTVNGTGFINSSTVQFNGTNRTTTFVSATQLTANITAADIATAGTANITVVNPAPGGGTSNALTLTISQAPNPVPTLTSLNPNAVTAGGAAFTLTVNGTNFINSSTVQFNGSNRTTTFVSSTQLTASITAADIATAGTANITVVNPAPGGGTSNALTLTINNPAPTTTSISPNTVTAGGAAFTLTVNGTNFVNGSTVQFNGSNRTTTFVSSTQLTASITAADIATASTANITVVNPAPGGGTSNAQTLTISQAPNPVPTLTSLNPNAVTAGSAAFTLTVNGTNFINGSVVRFNGSNRTTTFVSSTQVTANITAADIATAGTAQITVFNSAPGGGSSNALTLAINNPAPTLTSLIPNSALSGGAAFTLTVNGTGFVNGSTVQWNGSNRTTTFVNSTQLTAAIPAADIANVGTASVTVVNPTPGGGTSNALTFTISQAPNPVPTLTSLNPNAVTAGGAAFTLTVNGTNFVTSSVVQINGSTRATTFVSSTQLTANITAADIATAGTAAITVVNPAPGGGTSNALTLTINNPAPTTTSISPNTVTAGGAAFTLTVNGTNFVNGSTVQFNGSNRTTTFVSNTQLTANITAADIATAGTANITVVNPAPGGGTSNAQTLTINNPAPTLTSLSPTSAIAGGAAFTLTVNGTNFVAGSTVQFNGSNRTTTFVSATQLTANITAADIATAGTASVTVVNPTPGGGTSNALSFAINNPAPTLTSLNPNAVTAGGAAFTLTVNGTGFVNGSTVQLNGSNRTTTFVSATQLTANITAADIATANTAAITVVNPAPGGGTSNALTLTINNPTPTLTSLNPNSAIAGSGAFTLAVNGTGFVNGSVVQWNGSNRATTFVSSTQLTANIVAADVATAGTANVTVVNSAPGGGTSNALTFTINNPAPTLTSLNPNTVTTGGAAFTLTVNGTKFVNGSVVQFNGSNRTTTFVSSTQLTANITAADIATGGAFPITVVNPTPGGGTSNALTLTVNNPVPALTSLSPSTVSAGGPAFTLTVNGSNFVPGSAVQFNGSNRATTFVSSTQVTASITAADIAATGTAQITVFNPAPGGGLSNALTLAINNPVPVLTTLSPSAALFGGAAFTLTVNGTGFVNGSTVQWNGSNRTTTFVSSTQLTAAIPATDIANVGTASVTVVNPAPGGGASNALTFTILSTLSCETFCLRSAGYYRFHLNNLPKGQVLIGQVNANRPISTSNVNLIKIALEPDVAPDDPSADPLETLNREFVAAQLSLLFAGGRSAQIGALKSPLRCYGLNFAPVPLSNGFVFTPVTTLGDLFDQTRLALIEHRTADLLPLAQLLHLLNGDDLSGKCR